MSFEHRGEQVPHDPGPGRHRCAVGRGLPRDPVGLDGYGVAGLTFLRLAVASVALALAAPLMRVRLPRARDLPIILFLGERLTTRVVVGSLVAVIGAR